MAAVLDREAYDPRVKQQSESYRLAIVEAFRVWRDARPVR